MEWSLLNRQKMLLDAIQDKNLHLSKRRCSLKACLWCKGFSFYGWTGDYFAALLARSLSTLSLFPLPSPPRCLADGLSAPPPPFSLTLLRYPYAPSILSHLQTTHSPKREESLSTHAKHKHSQYSLEPLWTVRSRGKTAVAEKDLF